VIELKLGGQLITEPDVSPLVPEENILAELEEKIRSTSPSREKDARFTLLQWLRQRLSDPERAKSIIELLVSASKNAADKELASITLRCLSAGLLNDTSSSNEFTRAIVSISESGQPELCAYLKIDSKAQSYIKIQKLQSAHDQICELMSPFKSPFSDIDTALGIRKEILGKLNHGIVRSYCGVYDLQSIKSLVEGVYQRLKLVSDVGTSLLLDVESCKRSVEDGRQLVRENGSFIARDFLASFLDSIERTLSAFLQTSRERFSTAINARFAGTLQKRYPLHEPGRELRLNLQVQHLREAKVLRWTENIII
jgi:hypothetical protein